MIETIKFKVCTECKVEQELSCFSKHKRKKDGLSSQCKSCCKKYKDINKEKTAEYYRENKEKRAEYRKQYYKENKEKTAEYQKLNKDKIVEYNKKYSKTLKGRAINKNNIHKRRTVAKEGDVTTNQLSELQSNAKVCYWCNCNLKKAKIHIDHYIPLSRGGEHTLGNLVVSCATCNIKKNAKDPIEFANSIGKLC